MRALFSRMLVTVIVASCCARSSLAEEPASPLNATQMDDALGRYYGQERTTAYIASGLGFAAAGAGAYALTRRTDLGRRAGIPLLSLGALEGLGALLYAF